MATHWPVARALARSGSRSMMPAPGHWQKNRVPQPGPAGPGAANGPSKGHRRARPRWELAGPQGPIAWPPVSMPPMDFTSEPTDSESAAPSPSSPAGPKPKTQKKIQQD